MNILVIGMCGNSLFYSKNEKMLLREEPGGKGYNQAVAIKKLGQAVSFVGAIGKDDSGDKCSEYLDNLGVENHLIRKNGNSTFAKIYVDEFGNNDINVSLGVRLDFNDLDYIKDLINSHELIMLQNEIDENLNIKIIEHCILKNKKILVNPAPKCKWIKPYLNKIFIITPNEEEARYLFEISDEIPNNQIGKILLEKGYSNALVTLGSAGSVLIKDNNFKYFDSLKVKAVDTTGAGDLMNACIAYGIANDIDMEKSVELGTKACAYSVQRKYVLDSYPIKIEQFK